LKDLRVFGQIAPVGLDLHVSCPFERILAKREGFGDRACVLTPYPNLIFSSVVTDGSHRQFSSVGPDWDQLEMTSFSEGQATGEKQSWEKGLHNGGRDRDRTCDPLDVNEVLSR
jgi:hypothetical protein